MGGRGMSFATVRRLEKQLPALKRNATRLKHAYQAKAGAYIAFQGTDEGRLNAFDAQNRAWRKYTEAAAKRDKVAGRLDREMKRRERAFKREFK